MITTTKAINLSQLDIELGSHGLNMENDETTKTITPNSDSPITDMQLQAGITAHVAVFPPDPSVVKASGITKALSLGFTQAQAEAMFP